MRSENCRDVKLLLQSICIFFLVFPFLVSCARQPVYPAPLLKGTEVAVDVKTLRPERPVFFTYRYHGKNINFFVLKIHEEVLSFLDACMSCYPEKLGYRVDDAAITCKECNVRYSLPNIVKGFGSCLPIRIEGHLQDGEYHIPVSQLEGVADKF
jgi:uncharacterized membrane protein